jgi:hypothetical protein
MNSSKGLLGVLIFLLCFKVFGGVYTGTHPALIEVGEHLPKVRRNLGDSINVEKLGNKNTQDYLE